MNRTLFAFALAVSPLPVSAASAQDFTADPHAVDRCLGAHPDQPMLCVGREADACQQRHGGAADMVISACMAAEAAVWDGALNDAYRDVIALARARQTWDGPLYEPNSLTDALRDMQRSWIVYRDATCGHALALVRPFGSAAGPTILGCMMRETARQYLELQRIAQEYRQ